MRFKRSNILWILLILLFVCSMPLVAETTEDGAESDVDRILNCDLLVLDDLGTELTTQFVQTALYTLINTRLAAGRHTVISSNLSMDEVSRRYSPQIASRLAGEYHVLYFYGDDIRLVKKNRL